MFSFAAKNGVENGLKWTGSTRNVQENCSRNLFSIYFWYIRTVFLRRAEFFRLFIRGFTHDQCLTAIIGQYKKKEMSSNCKWSWNEPRNEAADVLQIHIFTWSTSCYFCIITIIMIIHLRKHFFLSLIFSTIEFHPKFKLYFFRENIRQKINFIYLSFI